MSDYFDPDRFRREQEARQQQSSGVGGGVALVVVGLMVLGLLFFAFVGDDGAVPADLAETATGAAAPAVSE